MSRRARVVAATRGGGWQEISCPVVGGRAFRSKRGLAVIVTAEVHDGERWLHVSYSRVDRVPSYGDGIEVKERFIGPARKAIAVLPPRPEHVNDHPYCLHLFSPLDRDPLPDFRMQDFTGRVSL